MVCNIMSGKIYKGSIAEITVPMFPRCYTGDTANLVVDFYVDGDTTSIEYSVSAGTITLDEYFNGTVVFQEAQLGVLPDGLLKYTTTCDEYLKEWETRYFICTPQDYTPVEYVTTDTVEEVVAEVMGDNYLTKTEAEETYAKKSDLPSVSGYCTTAEVETMIASATTGYTTTSQVESMIESAITGFVTSGEVDTMISTAITGFATTGDVESMISSATTGYTTTGDVQSMISSATSEFMTSGEVDTKLEDYAKLTDIPSLDNYATKQYVANSITASTENMVTSSTISNIWVGTETQYNNLPQKNNNTLYLIK